MTSDMPGLRAALAMELKEMMGPENIMVRDDSGQGIEKVKSWFNLQS